MEIEGLERLSKAKDKHIQQKEAEKLQFEKEIRQRIEQLLRDREDRSDPIQIKVHCLKYSILSTIMPLDCIYVIVVSLSEPHTSVFYKIIFVLAMYQSV